MKRSDTRSAADHPLSGPQREIWYDQTLHPGEPVYNVGGYVGFEEELDPSIFRRAVARVVDRHDALRLELEPAEPEPRQRAVKVRPRLPVVDLSALADGEREARRLMEREIARPFALYRGRLFRFALIRSMAGRWTWLQVYHHLVVDGWGIGLVSREVVDAYRTLRAGRQPDGERLASYLELARDDARYPGSAAQARDRAFWRERFRTPPEPLFADVDERGSPRSRVRTLYLDGALHDRLAERARERGASAFALYLGALAVVLGRTRAVRDLGVGVPLRNRRREARRTAGLFVAMVPVRLAFRAETRFASLLRQIARELKLCYRHRRFSASAVHRLAGLGTRGRSRLLDVTFSFEAHAYPARLVTLFAGSSPYPLSVALRQYAGARQLRLSLEGQLAALDPVELERLGMRLRTLLGALADDPERPAGELPLLTRAERHQVLAEWNTPLEEADRETATVHALFASRAARTPDAVALVRANAALTYAELAARSRRLARGLRRLGAGPEVRVGLAARRTPEMVVGLLAILESGGGYVPFDADHPRRRTAFQMRDAGIALLLADVGALRRLPDSGVQVVRLDLEPPAAVEPSAFGPPIRAASPPPIRAANLAYVLYTSGSTGRPKGVAICHRSAVALLRWAHRAFDREDFSGVLAATSLSFDLSVFEIFATLTRGGQVVLADSALELPESLALASRVRLLNTVPSVMRALLASGVRLPALATVNLAGEPLTSELAAAVLERFGAVRVHDLYGPSEDTTYSTWTRRRPGDPETIGRPIPGTATRVLDRALRLAPPGAIGELGIAGRGLARGYLGRAARTAACFVPDPWGGEAGGRLYRTGDLARALADGRLQFRGRIDHQVKVRGHRIELAEVEAALARHPAVRECAVLAAAGGAGEDGRELLDRLVAYVVTGGAARRLAEHLRADLPEYMIPAAFVELEALPRLVSGKVDRRALGRRPAPAERRESRAPGTPEEELLAAIWCHVLDLETLGADDDVFRLGAHSLHVARTVARIRRACGVELTAAEVFGAPTVAAQGARIRAASAGGRPARIPPIRPLAPGREPPPSFAQERLWALDRLEPGNPFYNVAGVWRLRGELRVEALRRAFEELVRRHAVLRTRFGERGGRPLARVAAPGSRPLPVADLARLPARARRREADGLIRREARRPFDLERDALLRTLLLRLGPGEHRLLVNQHHIVTDDASLRILAREVGRLYAALREGRSSPLEEPDLQYADFAAWQREWLGGVLEEQLGHWTRRLAGTASLALPIDRPRPPAPSYRGAVRTFVLDAALAGELRRLGRRHSATPFMTLLAAFLALLHRTCGQDDLAVGVPVAGRKEAGLEELPGLFVNTLVLRLEVSPAWSFAELLDRVRERTLEAFAHDDLPFERLLEALGLARDLSRAPLFQALFVHRDAPPPAPALPGLEVAAAEVPTGTAKLDLTLFLTEAGGALRGDFEYASDLFEPATVERMARRLESLLRAVAEDPGARLADLPILAPPQRRQLVLEERDAGSLRAPRPARAAAPRTPEEELVAGIFCEVLGRRKVGVTESFFELGGHSLTATRVASRLRASFGVELPVRALFEAPTAATLARRLASEAAGERPAPPIEPDADVAPEAPRPLSFAQERLWFLDRLHPGSALYNLPAALELRGEPSVQALERAFDELVRRHATLRTRCVVDRGRPAQVIERSGRRPLPMVDLTARPREAPRLLWREARRPFDLEREAPLRTVLLRLGERRHTLFVNLHHVAADGWSLGVLLRELEALYAAFRDGRPSPLEPLPIGYADFAAWQRRRLAGEALERLEGFWRARLEGSPPLELPTDRPRPPAPGHRGATRCLELSDALGERLLGLARRHDATLFMTLLAAFGVLLHRLSGQRDFTVGSPVANRNRQEIEGVVGFFVNTLVLRFELSRNESFSGLLRRTRDAALEAYAHQDLPFERLVKVIAADRDPARSPLFQVAFALQNAPLAEPRLAGLEVDLEPLLTRTAKFDLTLELAAPTAGLAASFEYATELFDATTVARIGSHYAGILEAVATAPGRALEELPWLTPAQQHQLQVEWSATPAPRAPRTPVPERLERGARRLPDAVAVAAPGAALSYGELDRRAGRLASRLRALGVGPEAAVAVWLERSPELALAALAAWKAGAAYLPLDPGAPPARIAFMLADAGARAVVADGRPRPAGVGVPWLDVRRAGRTEAPSRRGPAAPEGLAYLIYTSGSTGRPKPIAVTHGGLASLAAWHRAAYRIGPRDRTTLVANPAFDASVWETWAALTAGASLHVAPAEVLADPAGLVHWWRRLRITRSFLPTPLAEAVLAEPGLSGLALETLFVGGDRLRVRPRPGLPFEVANLYGPAECTVVALASRVAARGRGAPSIGRPIARLAFHVVDAALRPVAAGVAGELLIGGAGVGRGYAGRPALTAERFVPDPFARGAGGRRYRSGDRGRFLADGRIEFLGRLDRQVQVRGIRVEPGEIEALLRRHPAVREAAVTLAGASGAEALVAWVVPAPGRPAAGRDELRAFLRRRLPSAMVPSAFADLPELPLTSAGKIDRRALARLAPPVTARVAEAPRTPMEELVAGAFSEALAAGGKDGAPPIGADSDFFELGGHSLLAIRLVSRLREIGGVEVTVGEVFTHPTVGELAGALSRRSARPRAGAPPLERFRGTGDAPLSFAQQRLWLLHRLAPADPTYHQPLVLRLEGELRVAALAGALRAVVARHDALRTTFVRVAGEPVQRVTDDPGIELARVDLARLAPPAGDRVARAVLAAEARRPFDLERGPLLRARLLELEGRRLLFLNQPHIVSDGWSQSLFLRDLMELYAAGVAGRAAALPELPVTYGDYARWQRRWLTKEVLETLLDPWRRALGDDQPVLELPTDRPRPAARSPRGKSLAFRWPAALTAGLRRLGRGAGATLFMTLLAGWQALFHRLSGQRRIVLGSPAAHRTHAATEDLIGCFVNTLVLAVELDGGLAFERLVARTRRAALAAYAGEDLPFEKLVEALRPVRREDQNPFFRVMVALQSFPLPALASAESGLELVPEPVDTGTARFDLAFALMEDEGGGLEGIAEHSLDLFDATTVERMVRHARTLLEAAVADPGRRLAELPLMSRGERHQLTVESRPGHVPLATGGLHHLFEARARRSPAAPALIDEGAVVTYGALDARAARLAAALAARDVGPETVTGLLLERSADLVVGILGILKAGGAYLPLDPALPDPRLAWMLRDAGTPLVVTVTALAGRLPAGVEALCLDRDLPAGPVAAPVAPARPEQLAYVIYTSGSTGRPKGVGVTHGNVLRLLIVLQDAFGFGARDVWTLFHSFAFDFSVWEIWGALAWGGRVVVVPFEVSRSPADFRRLLAEQRVTVLNQTPSAFYELVRVEDRAAEAKRLAPQRLPKRLAPPKRLALRWVVFGGEALDPDRLASWFEHHGDGFARNAGNHGAPRLVNMYGITETTVHVTWRPLSRADVTRRRSPIGAAIPDLGVYLLDPAGRPVPTGVAGELTVGGAGVARGYLGRAALTAGRFVPDAFSDAPGARLYRSGDLARRRGDGDLEYLGRLDQQVQIRGFRVEPGEVAAVLEEHEAVDQAVVLARRVDAAGSNGDLRLVAWVVPAAGRPAPPADALRAFLKPRLPGYMIPAAFVSLDRLPLTANGKLDRAALADGATEARAAPSAAPRTEVESFVAELWRESLGLDQVGIHDNFFDLGGHSLLLVRIHEQLEEALGRELPRMVLFRNPTIASLGEHLAHEGAEPSAVREQAAEARRTADDARHRRAEDRRARARRQARRRRQLRDGDA